MKGQVAAGLHAVAQAPFELKGRNPDVLNTIANLSNDAVFTPPEFANQMLDTLAAAWAERYGGGNIWADKDVTFLDPFTKSGVFLREIVSRLTDGLRYAFPDLQQRVDHILEKQVFGIATETLTSLLARRSVYCSKLANGPHSITRAFDGRFQNPEQGNIWFDRTEHTWVGGTEKVIAMNADGESYLRPTNGRCGYCGASQLEYDRDSSLESHAYAFIHTDDIKARIAELFGAEMHFDVIIGNPPYQLGSGGGTRSVPIYQRFVQQAKALEPRFLAMVIPSRWMASGLGLKEFRAEMLEDRRIHSLIDFPSAVDVFPGVEIKAGVCYFLRDSEWDGDCNVTTVRGEERRGPAVRDLREYDVFVRDDRAVSILEKVLSASPTSINSILARDKEFGWTSNFDGFHAVKQVGDVPLHYIRTMKRGVGYIHPEDVKKSAHLIDTWKVLVPEAYNGGDVVPHPILGKSLIAPAPSACTQSFLFFYVDSEEAAKSVQSYYVTRFFRFLVSLRKITQHATHSTYSWVPIQTWDRTWTDVELYAKYGITEDEVTYIESLIRQMEIGDE